MKFKLGIFILFFSSLLNAQLTVKYNGVEIQNGDTISEVYIGPNMPKTFFTNIGLKNNSNQSQSVVIKSDRSKLALGTECRMCWGGVCYGPMLDQTPNSVNLNTGASTNGFESTYYPNDLPNTSSLVRYTFIDLSHPEDSAWVYCLYAVYHELIDIQYKDDLLSVENNRLTLKENAKVESIFNSYGQQVGNVNKLNSNEMYYIVVLYNNKRFSYKLFLND